MSAAVCVSAVDVRAVSAQSALITGAMVYDGTGAAPRAADVRVRDGKIVAVGKLARASGEAVVDAKGLALAPGFIDTHSHHDWGLDKARDAMAVVSQGVTTIVVGQDGGSHYPLKDFFGTLDAAPAAVNVASYSGHATLRTRVMGKDYKRMATDAEIARMAALLRDDMRAGALGLSTGLEYDAAISSASAEVILLAREVAKAGGRYISHIRSEDRSFWAALDEIITIGREARLPVQVSHMKLAQRSLWGKTDSLQAILNAARKSGVNITADVYPYTYWHSTITVLFPDRDYASRAAAEFALTQVSSPEGVMITDFSPEPSYRGKTIAQIAALRGTDAPQTLMDLVAMANKDGVEEGINAVSMAEADVNTLIAWPWANVCSDGQLEGLHPRGWGSFPKVLAMHRTPGAPRLETLIHKMTGLSAANVGLTGRGTIAVGQAADLVLFDPATVKDQATPQAPMAPSVGIRRVWVNGVAVYDGAHTTGAFPGKALRRPTR
jgi:N-acyl-D-amino-acid deacylase